MPERLCWHTLRAADSIWARGKHPGKEKLEASDDMD
jgi:hypothetical protein